MLFSFFPINNKLNNLPEKLKERNNLLICGFDQKLP